MLLIGSDDGVYRMPDPAGSPSDWAAASADGEAASPERVLASGRVKRLVTPPALDGVFAATGTGLSHSPDGEHWRSIPTPRERVYAVGVGQAGDRLYLGTRPAHLYVTDPADALAASDGAGDPGWRDLEGFQDLPSRDEWRLPRHENTAQVRDVHVDPADPDRVLAGVEVGGVHVSEDGGETWTERRDGVDDDVHELRVVAPGEYVAATGFGLFRTRDAGRSWVRLAEGFEQRYFRTVRAVDGSVYAGAALASSSSWEDEDADPQLFVLREDEDTVEPVDIPRPAETVTGIADLDGRLAVGTHRGSLFVRAGEEWVVDREFPVSPDHVGRYTPLTAFDP